jgi:hypothetical protein
MGRRGTVEEQRGDRFLTRGPLRDRSVLALLLPPAADGPRRRIGKIKKRSPDERIGTAHFLHSRVIIV